MFAVVEQVIELEIVTVIYMAQKIFWQNVDLWERDHLLLCDSFYV